MANDRIYYAIHAVGFRQQGVGDDDAGEISNIGAHGVQSIGITTNFNLQQVFELGQLAIYENVEDTPDVEVSVSKVLDGHPLLYHLATANAGVTGPHLASRTNTTTFFNLQICDDSAEYVTSANNISTVSCSGMRVSSASYSFPSDGFFTEDLTLVGNDKVWANDPKILNANALTRSAAISGMSNTTSSDGADGPYTNQHTQRRQDLIWANAVAADRTILPQEVFGIDANGHNALTAGVYGAHVSNITVSVDLAREDLNELGRRLPYSRTTTYPIEVTCEIEVITSSGDMISATEAGIYNTGTACAAVNSNLQERSITVCTCEGTRVYLGDNNKLQSVNYSGGDATGGNVSVSYSFTTFNDFTVLHPQDPHASGAGWYAARAEFWPGDNS